MQLFPARLIRAFGGLQEVGTKQIPFDIAEHREQVLVFLYRKRLEASPVQMVRPAL
jgi:hypothetical protein